MEKVRIVAIFFWPQAQKKFLIISMPNGGFTFPSTEFDKNEVCKEKVQVVALGHFQGSYVQEVAGLTWFPPSDLDTECLVYSGKVFNLPKGGSYTYEWQTLDGLKRDILKFPVRMQHVIRAIEFRGCP